MSDAALDEKSAPATEESDTGHEADDLVTEDLVADDLVPEGLVPEDLVTEDLVEEVSIDGMCGVY